MSQRQNGTRSVSPIVYQAVVAALTSPDHAGEKFLDTFPTEAKPDEATHNSQLKLLLSVQGPESVLSVGRDLGRSGDSPILHILASSAEPVEVFEVFERLEPLFHLGNKTIHTMITNGAQIRHVPRLSPSIHIQRVCLSVVLRLGCLKGSAVHAYKHYLTDQFLHGRQAIRAN